MADDITDNSLVDAAKDFLGKKYGPLPLGAWLLIAGATAYFVAKWARGRNAEPTPVATDVPESDTDLPMPSNASNAVGMDYSAPGGTSGIGGTTTSAVRDDSYNPQITAPGTNADWQTRAVGILVDLGYNAFAATMAVRTYLSGGTLSSEQSAMITAAVKALGAPPNIEPTATDKGKPIITVGFAQNPGKAYTTVRMYVSVRNSATGDPMDLDVMIQHQYPAVGNGWKDVGPIKVTGGRGVTPVGPTIVPGKNSFRAVSKNREYVSNTLTIRR